jgi:polyhydroxybutyrate depolymerase
VAHPNLVARALSILFALGGASIACSQDPVSDDGVGGGSNQAATGGAAGPAVGGATTGGAGSGAGATGGSVGGVSGTAGQATGGDAAQAGVGGSNSGASGAAGAPMGGAGAAGASGGAAGSSMAGSAGAGTGGTAGAGMGSMGCGMAVTQTARQWVEATPLDVSGAMRRWWTYLPNNYDPMRRYPVVYLFHGCGNETNNVAMQNVVGENAILVRGKAVSDCWVTDTNSADVAFFDALVTAFEGRYCADTTRRFAVGYSSGSWLINTLECVRGGVLRAAASVAGGSPRRNSCTGPTLARLFVHDADDMDNDISGSITERDRLLTANGCNATAMPVPEDPAPCARYQGCMPGVPVIWCETMGQGHARQDTLAGAAAWGLFTEF